MADLLGEFLGVLARVGRAAGFARRGPIFTVTRGEDRGIIAAQTTRWGIPKRRFVTLNLGVDLAVLRPYDVDRAEGEPSGWRAAWGNCQWRVRVGTLLEGSDVWWACDDQPEADVGVAEMFVQQDAIGDFARVVEQTAIPGVLGNMRASSLRDYWLDNPLDEASRASRLLYAAVLSHELHDLGAAKDLAVLLKAEKGVRPVHLQRLAGLLGHTDA